MQKILLLDTFSLGLTIERLCRQLIENHDDFQNSVLIGLQPKGRFLADRIQTRLEQICGSKILSGYIDTTFYRDDFRRRDEPLKPMKTNMPFLIENKKVVLIDDVLFTGRSVRAALTAIAEFGRPDSVELLVLIDRKYSRDLPVQADYVGKSVNTIQSQRVSAEWTEAGFSGDSIWLTAVG